MVSRWGLPCAAAVQNALLIPGPRFLILSPGDLGSTQGPTIPLVVL